MTDKETFFQDDRPILIYEARRPSVDRPHDVDGVPAQPVNVEARIFDATNGTLVSVEGSTVIPLGDITIPGDLLTMSPMDETTDRGALIYVTIPTEVTAEAGNYTLYVTTEYADGLRVTHDQKIQVAEYA